MSGTKEAIVDVAKVGRKKIINMVNLDYRCAILIAFNCVLILHLSWSFIIQGSANPQTPGSENKRKQERNLYSTVGSLYWSLK